MAEIMEIVKRIWDLRAFRRALISGNTDQELLPAALDWIDMTIAEHQRDLLGLIKRVA